jgi:hypothetical protein
MSKRSVVSSLFVQNASLCLAAALAGVVGCSSDVGQLPGAGGVSAGGNPGSTAGTTAMTTGGMPVTPPVGGSPTTAGTTATGGGGASTGGSGGSGGNPPSGGSGGSTAGGSSGGSSGSGGGGGAGGGGSADCKSFKLCDDFETDAPGMGASPWKVSQGSGYTVAVDTAQHHSGMKSVHIMAPTGTGTGALTESKTFPATDFWGRAWMRFKAASGGHQMFVAVNVQGDQYRLFNTLGTDTFRTNEQKGDAFYDSGTKIPMETWFCFEWHIAASGASIYLDGMEMTKAKPTGWTVPSMSSLQIGYQRFQAGTSAGEIWLDDIAINTTQIGCQ